MVSSSASLALNSKVQQYLRELILVAKYCDIFFFAVGDADIVVFEIVSHHLYHFAVSVCNAELLPIPTRVYYLSGLAVVMIVLASRRRDLLRLKLSSK